MIQPFEEDNRYFEQVNTSGQVNSLENSLISMDKIEDTIYEGGNFAYEKQNKDNSVSQVGNQKSGFMEKEAEFVKSLRDV